MSSIRSLAGVAILAALCSCLDLAGHPGRARADAPATEAERGITPTDAQGRPLNLDFESGDLRDWKVEGDAFEGQPIEGDTVAARKKMASRHEGKYWVGGYERKGDVPQGTLTSLPFQVT